MAEIPGGGWSEVGLGQFAGPKDKQPGDVIVEGWYLKSVPGQYEKPNYEFLLPDGSKRTVFGNGFIHKAMEEVMPGDYCRMVYGGQGLTSEKSKYKNRPQHIVKVFRNPQLRGLVQNGCYLGPAPMPVATSPAPAVAPAFVAATVNQAPVPVPNPAPAPVASDDEEVEW